MSLTAAQIVNLACQIAKAPGFIVQAGRFMNVVLSDLCQTYDFDVARKTSFFTLTSALGSGPHLLPSDYLRVDPNDFFYTVNGVPYKPVNVDLAEYDGLVQQAGLASYPSTFATDMSTAPPGLYVWPPPGGNYSATIRYRAQMADIAAPEASATVPWFPNQNYLITRVAGELMKITNDDRWRVFLSDSDDAGAGSILRAYLNLKDDKLGRALTVKLDRRRFGTSISGLRNTKTIGW